MEKINDQENSDKFEKIEKKLDIISNCLGKIIVERYYLKDEKKQEIIKQLSALGFSNNDISLITGIQSNSVRAHKSNLSKALDE